MLQELIKNRVKKIARKNKTFDKIMRYVEDPNELDIQVHQIQKTIYKQGEYIEELEKDVAILKKNSHPPQEYICCGKCGCEIAKVKLEKEK